MNENCSDYIPSLGLLFNKIKLTTIIKYKRNIINFDELSFCVKCLKGHDIHGAWLHKEILFYVISSENRRSLIMINMINAAGTYPPKRTGSYTLSWRAGKSDGQEKEYRQSKMKWWVREPISASCQPSFKVPQ